MKRKIALLDISLLLILIVVTSVTVSKYQNVLSGESNTNVAKWSNKIELVDTDSIIFNSGEDNIKSIHFNLKSDSDVSSKYDINVQNVPKYIELNLENNETSIKCLVDTNTITVTFYNQELSFDLSKDNEEKSITGGTVHMTIQNDASQKNVFFTNSLNSSTLHVTIPKDDPKVDMIFGDFGKIEYGNKSIEHIITLKANSDNLPNIAEMNLSATFEQID